LERDGEDPSNLERRFSREEKGGRSQPEMMEEGEKRHMSQEKLDGAGGGETLCKAGGEEKTLVYCGDSGGT